MEMQNLEAAFVLTIIAGLSTGIGSTIAFLTKRTNTSVLSFALSFSAGVMIYVSFVEIFFEARETLISELGTLSGQWAAVASFFAGILLVGLIDRLVPTSGNPHDFIKIKNGMAGAASTARLFRLGVLTAAAITVHNFPEGIAAFTAALKDVNLGIPIAVAIGIHNIPEGIAVCIPIYYATGSRRKAFYLSFLSGLAEPLGAVIGYLILNTFFSNTLFGSLFAMVGGIMVYIALDELLPAAREYGEQHMSVYGLVLGMLVMSVSLLLLG